MRLIGCLLTFAAVALSAPKPLSIQRIALSQYEDGPNVGAGYEFVPGEAIFFSFHISGYKAIGDEGPRVSVTFSVQAFDPKGVPIVEPVSGKVDTELDPEDKDWMPKGRATIAVPEAAPSGQYTIELAITDRVAQTQASAKAVFHVKGLTIQPSDKLVVRNFHFYRREEDRQPLTMANFRPGDTLWAKFEMTGYKFGAKNAFEVGYGLAVLRPNGETMFRQADAAVEKQASFYPRTFLPAAMSLNLDKDLKPGTYTLVVLVSDKVGGQSVESRQEFTVE